MSSDQLILKDPIGSGGYGTVFRALWATRDVAVKKFHVTQNDVREDDAIKREIALLERLRDKHVVLFYGKCYYQGQLVLIMEYAEGGSLHRAIKKHLLDWPAKRRIAQGIIRGLAYIHHENVIHRDLKSMNVLLNKHMEAQLCDFGLAKVKMTSLSKTCGDQSVKGTMRWMAPELFLKRPKYTTKSDIYALGMVMWEMAANCTMPFQEHTEANVVIELIKRGEREDLPDDTPADYRRWVERCWEDDPAKRPEASEMDVHQDEPDDSNESCECDSILALSMDSQRLIISTPSSENAAAANQSVPSIIKRKAPPPYSVSDAERSIAVIRGVSALLDAAEKGDIEAQMALAALYEKGEGVARSDSEAFKWYLRAAELKHAPAEFKVGSLFYNGRAGKKSYSAAAFWFRRAANQGNADAYAGVGDLYLSGHGVNKDVIEALSWYRKAAAQGNAQGQHGLGYMYQQGYGVEQNHVEAVLYYRRSAEQGNARGQCSLGYMYQNGFGVEQDYAEAMVWYRKSAEQGDATGQCHLGNMYNSGLGVEQSDVIAMFWYRKAADQGEPSAQWNVGMMHYTGQGVPKDKHHALHWFRRALDRGHKGARDKIKELERSKGFFNWIFG